MAAGRRRSSESARGKPSSGKGGHKEAEHSAGTSHSYSPPHSQPNSHPHAHPHSHSHAHSHSQSDASLNKAKNVSPSAKGNGVKPKAENGEVPKVSTEEVAAAEAVAIADADVDLLVEEEGKVSTESSNHQNGGTDMKAFTAPATHKETTMKPEATAIHEGAKQGSELEGAGGVENGSEEAKKKKRKKKKKKKKNKKKSKTDDEPHDPLKAEDEGAEGESSSEDGDGATTDAVKNTMVESPAKNDEQQSAEVVETPPTIPEKVVLSLGPELAVEDQKMEAEEDVSKDEVADKVLDKKLQLVEQESVVTEPSTTESVEGEVALPPVADTEHNMAQAGVSVPMVVEEMESEITKEAADEPITVETKIPENTENGVNEKELEEVVVENGAVEKIHASEMQFLREAGGVEPDNSSEVKEAESLVEERLDEGADCVQANSDLKPVEGLAEEANDGNALEGLPLIAAVDMGAAVEEVALNAETVQLNGKMETTDKDTSPVELSGGGDLLANGVNQEKLNNTEEVDTKKSAEDSREAEKSGGVESSRVSPDQVEQLKDGNPLTNFFNSLVLITSNCFGMSTRLRAYPHHEA